MSARTPTALFVRSELRRHRRGWVMVALIAAVGIAVTVTAAAGARRTLTSFERFRYVSNEPHVLLASEGNGPSPVSVDELEALGGVDRALGLTGADVKWAIAWQSWAMAALSILIGLPAGLVTGRAAWQALADSLGTVAPSQFPAAIVGLVPAAAFAASLVAIPVAWHTAKNSAVSALRTE